jgi:bifunctional non-homologous end joining protein LigD
LDSYEKGRLTFALHGEKLAGAWHLVRMRGRPNDRRENWLLIKSADAAARSEDDPDILDEKTLSVATGRTMEEIAEGKRIGHHVWRSNRAPAAKRTAAKHKAATPGLSRKSTASG